MARKKNDAEPDFEQALRQLEEIVRRLEEEEVPLETSLKLFADGQQLVRACETKLRAAENQVRMLIENGAGEIAEEDFEKTAEAACGDDLAEPLAAEPPFDEEPGPSDAAGTDSDDEELPF